MLFVYDDIQTVSNFCVVELQRQVSSFSEFFIVRLLHLEFELNLTTFRNLIGTFYLM